MADGRPTNTSELLQRMDGEWRPLMQLAERLTPEQMSKPDAGGWSPKDNLAHLTEWMRYMKKAYVHQVPGYEAMGIEQEKWRQLDEEGINAVLFERNRHLAPEQVLDMLRSTYAEVVEDLLDVPFESLLGPVRPDKPDSGQILDFVLGNTSDHFAEHRQNIEKGL